MPRPATQSLAFGTLRWFFELEACLDALLDRPGAKQDPEVRALMLVGLYQLLHGATPEHAAVSETVEAARALGRPRAAGLVNAILRRCLREREAIIAAAHSAPRARATPIAEWMLDAFARDWPGQWESIAAAGNAEPPMWLRVNALRGTREDYLSRLKGAGLAAEPADFAPEALRLAQPMSVDALPGFADGEVSVQDAAAQLAPRSLARGARHARARRLRGTGRQGLPRRRARARPRGARRARRRRGARDAHRVEPRAAAASPAQVVVGDCAQPAAWWDGRPFDRILLDVPCSGTGVIRRHPDIKLLRRAGDIARFAAQQAALLRACWGLLAPGGRLVYASCSVLHGRKCRRRRSLPRRGTRGGRGDRIC